MLQLSAKSLVQPFNAGMSSKAVEDTGSGDDDNDEEKDVVMIQDPDDDDEEDDKQADDEAHDNQAQVLWNDRPFVNIPNCHGYVVVISLVTSFLK